MDIERLASGPHCFKIFTAVMPQTKVKTLAGYRLLNHVGVSFQLVSNRGSNEVGPVGVEMLVFQERNSRGIISTRPAAAYGSASKATIDELRSATFSVCASSRAAVSST